MLICSKLPQYVSPLEATELFCSNRLSQLAMNLKSFFHDGAANCTEPCVCIDAAEEQPMLFMLQSSTFQREPGVLGQCGDLSKGQETEECRVVLFSALIICSSLQIFHLFMLSTHCSIHPAPCFFTWSQMLKQQECSRWVLFFVCFFNSELNNIKF